MTTAVSDTTALAERIERRRQEYRSDFRFEGQPHIRFGIELTENEIDLVVAALRASAVRAADYQFTHAELSVYLDKVRAAWEAAVPRAATMPSEVSAFLLNVRSVLARRFPRCRDCADDGPICPSSGLPCDLDKAFREVSRAVNQRKKPNAHRKP